MQLARKKTVEINDWVPGIELLKLEVLIIRIKHCQYSMQKLCS